MTSLDLIQMIPVLQAPANNYLSIGLPIGLILFFVIGLIGVKVELAKRPTFKEANEKYKDVNVCDEIHKSVNEKLACIPEIKECVTEIRTILKERSKK